jgi:hypothetical protein
VGGDWLEGRALEWHCAVLIAIDRKMPGDTLRVQNLVDGDSRVAGTCVLDVFGLEGMRTLTAEVARMPHTYTNSNATEYIYILS